MLVWLLLCAHIQPLLLPPQGPPRRESASFGPPLTGLSDLCPHRVRLRPGDASLLRLFARPFLCAPWVRPSTRPCPLCPPCPHCERLSSPRDVVARRAGK